MNNNEFPRIYRGGCAPSYPDSIVEAAEAGFPDSVVAAAAEAARAPVFPGQSPGVIFVAILRQNIETLKAEIAEKQGELGGLQLALNTYLQTHNGG